MTGSSWHESLRHLTFLNQKMSVKTLIQWGRLLWLLRHSCLSNVRHNLQDLFYSTWFLFKKNDTVNVKCQSWMRDGNTMQGRVRKESILGILVRHVSQQPLQVLKLNFITTTSQREWCKIDLSVIRDINIKSKIQQI